MPDTSTHPPAHPVVPGSSTPVVLPQINIAEVEAGLNTFVNVLPILATFFPPLAVVTPFIPVIKGLLVMAQELQGTGQNPEAIVGVISKHLEQLSGQMKALVPPPPAAE